MSDLDPDLLDRLRPLSALEPAELGAQLRPARAGARGFRLAVLAASLILASTAVGFAATRVADFPGISDVIWREGDDGQALAIGQGVDENADLGCDLIGLSAPEAATALERRDLSARWTFAEVDDNGGGTVRDVPSPPSIGVVLAVMRFPDGLRVDVIHSVDKAQYPDRPMPTERC